MDDVGGLSQSPLATHYREPAISNPHTIEAAPLRATQRSNKGGHPTQTLRHSDTQTQKPKTQRTGTPELFDRPWNWRRIASSRGCSHSAGKVTWETAGHTDVLCEHTGT